MISIDFFAVTLESLLFWCGLRYNRRDVAAGAQLYALACAGCHGPGGEHVKEGSEKFGTIVSLGDKCDSCVILQICGACHDDANDPGFEFEVQDKIDRQRHGTTEAGTDKPLGASSARLRPNDAALLAHAFAEKREPKWTGR